MTDNMAFVLSTGIRFFFLFTPFFALSMFLGFTRGYSPGERTKLAVTISIAVAVLCFVLFFFGTQVFRLFGITLDAFRVGAGALLFLSAVHLIHPKTDVSHPDPDDEFAVVPLAMPVIVGPATVGALMVMGAEITDPTQKLWGCAALLLAILGMGILLTIGAVLEKLIGRKGIHILSRITALILAALAAQMIMTGIQNFGYLSSEPTL